jgi:8-oxo-dGTP diphosphatase
LNHIVLAIIVHLGKVLIIRRKHKSEEVPDLLWAFPGGKVEPDESFEQAVHREASEETGLTIRVIAPIFERIFPGTQINARYFHCQLSEGFDQTVIPDKNEIAEWRWVPGPEALNFFTSNVAEPIEEFLRELDNSQDII